VPRLRLIKPRNPLNGLVQGDVARRITFGRKAIFMPLGLLVTAGVVPRDWQVEIVDECTRTVPVAAGRILTRDWARYNGASVVFEPRRMSARQLANCQTAAFKEFFSWASLWERLTL